MSKSSRVLLIRHGETALNTGNERIRGFKNIPLNDKGRRQAIEAAIKLQEFPISVVYCSPLDRAVETAKPIARLLHASLIETKSALPWSPGPTIQGQLVSKVLPLIKHYANSPLETPPKGERFKDFTDRFLAFLSEKLDECRTKTTDTAIVAHSRCLQLARAWDSAGRPKDFSYDVGVQNNYTQEMPVGSILILDCDGREERR